MKKFLLTVIVIILVIAAGLIVFKDTIIKGAIEKVVRDTTGLHLTMETLTVGLQNQTVDIKELKLRNPSDFEDKIMFDFPEIYVDCDVKAIMEKHVHLEDMTIHLRELSVVKNSKGELNLNALKAVAREGEKPAEEKKAPAKEAKETKPMTWQIDKLHLKIEKAVYKDYSKGKTPEVYSFDINIDEQFENITDPYKLVVLLVTRTLAKTTIAQLANFNLKALEGSVSGIVAGVQEQATQAVDQLKKIADGEVPVGEGVKNITEDTKKSVDSLKDQFKGLFKKDED
ncbi:MAG: AsmA family protein [bacterium]|nr:AsmA family protein [bacterium]